MENADKASEGPEQTARPRSHPSRRHFSSPFLGELRHVDEVEVILGHSRGKVVGIRERSSASKIQSDKLGILLDEMSEAQRSDVAMRKVCLGSISLPNLIASHSVLV